MCGSIVIVILLKLFWLRPCYACARCFKACVLGTLRCLYCKCLKRLCRRCWCWHWRVCRCHKPKRENAEGKKEKTTMDHMRVKVCTMHPIVVCTIHPFWAYSAAASLCALVL